MIIDIYESGPRAFRYKAMGTQNDHKTPQNTKATLRQTGQRFQSTGRKGHARNPNNSSFAGEVGPISKTGESHENIKARNNLSSSPLGFNKSDFARPTASSQQKAKFPNQSSLPSANPSNRNQDSIGSSSRRAQSQPRSIKDNNMPYIRRNNYKGDSRKSSLEDGPTITKNGALANESNKRRVNTTTAPP